MAVGLAWTPLGGELMFVEASRMEGDGQLTLTGQLGDVMKESAHLAISWLRTNAKRYRLTNRECLAPPLYGARRRSVRLTAAVSLNSDGESGSAGRDRHPPPLPCRGGDEGRPVCRRYHSYLPGLPVQRAPGQVGRRHDRRDHAQGARAAGEAALRCAAPVSTPVMLLVVSAQVGGIKDKVLAAHRGGVKCVVLPKRNEKDLEELPANVRADLDFILAQNLDEVLDTAFEGGFPGRGSSCPHPQLTSKL